MRLLSAALGALLVPHAAAAVFRDQVGRIDFHHALVGLPQDEASSFFHRPRLEDKASLLYSLSDAAGGVLAAVNPSNGALMWRQLLAEADGDADDNQEQTTTSVRAHVLPVPGEGWLATGRGGAVHAWNAVSGRSLWRTDLAGDVAGLAVVPPVVDAAGGLAARHDVLALVADPAAGGSGGGAVLHRVGGVDGGVRWTARDGGHGLRPLHVAVSADQAFVVGLHGAQLKVVVLDLKSGHRVSEHSLGGDVAPADVLFVGNGGADPARVPPVVVWADGARAQLRVQVLTNSKHLPSKNTFALPPDTADVLVHAVRQPQAPTTAPRPLHFLVHARTAGGRSHSAQVYHVDAATHAVAQAYALPAAAGAGAFAASVGGDSTVYFTRITDAEVVLTASAADAVLGRWPLAAVTAAVPVPAGAAAAEVVAKPGGNSGDDGSSSSSFAVRAAVVSADDAWVLVRNGQVAWARPEGLAGAVAAVLAEPAPVAQQLVRALEQEAHSNPLAAYAHRVRRHVDDLRRLPAFLQALPGRLARSVLGGGGSDTAADPFGFHKLAVLATRRGRLYGLDAASPGAVQWTTRVPQAPVPWAVQRIHADEAAGVALAVGPTVRASALVRIATGELLPLLAAAGEEVPAFAAAFAAIDPDAPLASTAWVTGADGARWVLPVVAGADGAAAVPAAALAAGGCPQESIMVRDEGGLHGVRFVLSKDGNGACTAETTWTFAPPPGFRIAAVAARPAHDPVASIGRVLADRRVLYKYLNANVAVVAAVDEAAAALLTVVLDTVSGQVVATAAHGGVDGRKPVDCLVVEHSVLCTFFGDGAGGVKGYQLALSDLYASREPNERGLGGSSSTNVSAVRPLGDPRADGGSVLPAVFAQTWVVPTRLTALAATQTRQGITVREVLAFAPRLHGVVGLPRVGGVLDARRPVGREPTAGEAVDEGLARYAPALSPGALDGRLVLSHARDVAGVRALATAATHVESTCLVLAYGALDVFGTRVAPSLAFDLLDQGFNKLSMLGTVAALAVGVALLRPMVAKKQIDLRWSAPL